MKKLLSSFGIMILLLLSGCNNNSNNSDPLQGQWKLVNVTGTFAGINSNFSEGMITWDFNPITQTVTVTNHNTDSSLWDVFETGVYTYHFVNNPNSPCGQSIDINGSEYGCYSVSNNTLVINQSIADGFAITLKR
jgi:hypothetical protein